MKVVRPMLASDAADLNSLTYPLLASAKLDGIRCVILNGKALTRSLKPIPNDYIRSLLESHANCLEGFDGELYLHGVGYNEIQSAVMQREGSPVVTFYLFDNIHRTTSYQEWYDANLSVNLPTPCTVLPQSLIESEQQLREFQKQTLEAGYEGVMLRSLSSPYKFGRSTLKQGYLLKVKQFKDMEATIVGFTELMQNGNEAYVSETGYTKRSSEMAGLTPLGVLGAFTCSLNGVEFNVSTGLSKVDRELYWARRNDLIGSMLKFKFFELSSKGVPRFPVFLGLRSELDK